MKLIASLVYICGLFATLVSAEYRAFELELKRDPANTSSGPLASTNSSGEAATSGAEIPLNTSLQVAKDPSTPAQDPNAPPAQPNVRLIITTLDDIQYPEYYHLAPNESLRIVNTWMCRGRTGDGRAPCAKPPALGPNPQPDSAKKP